MKLENYGSSKEKRDSIIFKVLNSHRRVLDNNLVLILLRK